MFLAEKYVIISTTNLVQQLLDLYADDGVSGYKMRVTIDDGTTPLVMVFCMSSLPCSWSNFLQKMATGQNIILLHCNLRIQIAFTKHCED
jgi:hypothetical protein